MSNAAVIGVLARSFLAGKPSVETVHARGKLRNSKLQASASAPIRKTA